MKNLIPTLGLLACVGTLFAAEEITLITHLHEDGNHAHRVSKAQLLPGMAWDPEIQPLRFDLHTQITRAREACLRANDHVGGIDVWEILFRKDYRQEKQRLEANETNGYWFVTFSFQLTKPGAKLRLREVVMLLDGTLASETKEPLRPRENRGSGQSQPTTAQPYPALTGTNAAILTEASGFVSPQKIYERLREPDFVIPTVQWHPFTEEFPFDLGEEANRSRKHLQERKNMNDEIMLREIRVEGYFPSGAIEARQEDDRAHKNHWFVGFEYWTPARSEPLEYGCYMLLDRTTLQDSVRPWPWVDVDPKPWKPK